MSRRALITALLIVLVASTATFAAPEGQLT